MLNCVQFSATPWTVACQAPLSMGFSRLEYWSGLPYPPLGVLPDPGIEPRSPALQADSLPSELPGKTQEDPCLQEVNSVYLEQPWGSTVIQAVLKYSGLMRWTGPPGQKKRLQERGRDNVDSAFSQCKLESELCCL